MKLRYTLWGAVGGTLLGVAPGTPLWALAGAGLLVHFAVEERPQLVGETYQLARTAPAQLRAGVRRLQGGLAQLQAPSSPATAPAGRQSPAAAPAAQLGARDWLAAVNDRPDDNPHMTVVGPSGCGKTTFVSAALGARPGRVVVLTPKVSPGAWRGAQVITLDDDLSYEPLAAALAELQTEARRRSVALKRGQRLEPLTVVLDELPELHAEIPGAGRFAVRLSRWGRELNMRQVVIATSDDALNIPGWAATRPNYVRVELAKPTPDGARPAWLDDGQGRRQLDLRDLRSSAERAQLRPWHEPAPAAIPDDVLASLLAEAIPLHSDAEERRVNPVPGNGSNDPGGHSSVTVDGAGGQPVTVNVTQIAPAASGGRRAPDDPYSRALEALYEAAGAQGLTFAKVYAQHKGTKEIVFTAWQRGRDTRKGIDDARRAA